MFCHGIIAGYLLVILLTASTLRDTIPWLAPCGSNHVIHDTATARLHVAISPFHHLQGTIWRSITAMRYLVQVQLGFKIRILLVKV